MAQCVQPGQTVLTGDCREVLTGFAENTFTACVTDPPYELGFMGKSWDKQGVAFDPETWKAVLRVLKPGAFLLAFGGTRTYHRIACAIEDAGFELRDCVMYVFGSGFPKSHDISKAIDKAAGAERKVVGVRKYAEGHVQKSSDDKLAPPIGTFIRAQDDRLETSPATAAAAMWNGYGTALKPAYEPIIVSMKPLDGTFAANAVNHGVAGLNIDGCRVPAGEDDYNHPGDLTKRPMAKNTFVAAERGCLKVTQAPPNTLGRWPANLIHDGSEEVVELFPQTTSGSGIRRPTDYVGGVAYGYAKSGKGAHSYERDGDSGSAARFFYCAKASRSERTHKGKVENNHPTVKPLSLMEYLLKLVTMPENNSILDPFAGSGTTLVACKTLGLDAVGIELEYGELAQARLAATQYVPKQLSLL